MNKSEVIDTNDESTFGKLKPKIEACKIPLFCEMHGIFERSPPTQNG
jgi:hypothetical protein